jgi:hypothetical protein
MYFPTLSNFYKEQNKVSIVKIDGVEYKQQNKNLIEYTNEHGRTYGEHALVKFSQWLTEDQMMDLIDAENNYDTVIELLYDFGIEVTHKKD